MLHRVYLSVLCALLSSTLLAAQLATPKISYAYITNARLTVQVERVALPPGPFLPPGVGRIIVTVFDANDSTCCRCEEGEFYSLYGHASIVRMLDPCGEKNAPQAGSLWVGAEFEYADRLRGPMSPLYKVTWTTPWQCAVVGW